VRFSKRIGKSRIKTELQIESMDVDLRVSLWNAFQVFYLEKVDSNWISDSSFNRFFRSLWHNFLKRPLDNLDNYFPSTRQRLRDLFYKWQWHEVYDFIEFISQIECPANTDEFREFCNEMMEREVSGYRFVDKLITEITDENEMKEIEEAIEVARKTKLTGVRKHLKTSLSLMSDRKNPDYRNSVKESICAVESIAQIISQNTKAELGKALKVIEDKIGLHGALKKGFMAIYGYTSDEGGIRHAMLEESNVDFGDAKYMLVSCSAFINYLIMKASKAGIKF